jgi:murein DD-endopeptidase MepM/ murein hydrolase activator NlpD
VKAATTATPASPKAAPHTGPAWTWLPVLEPGSRDRAVRVLQGKLGVKVTGWYGPMTLVAVQQFQASRGLPAQGYVGQLTWRALASDFRLGPAPAASAAADSSGSSASATSSSTPSSTPRASAPSTGGRICPAPGASFGQGWGAPRSGHSHQGMDMVGSYGSAILAVESGTVIRAGRQSNGALRIVLAGSSGSKFYYGHMSSLSVSAGQHVSRGQVIGRMGDSGSPGAVHLHFEFWRSGGESAAVDPGPLLRQLC